jgi:GT2 family glycosyltransferase
VRHVDVLIASGGFDERLRGLTRQALETLAASEPYVRFHPLVLESHRPLSPFQYDHAERTVYPEGEFGYNRYMSLGVRLTGSEFVCLCNNDLVFKPGWASALLAAMDAVPDLQSASPFCEHLHGGYCGIPPNSGLHYGYTTPGPVAGWCIFQRRALYDRIGLPDERFAFWYADDDYAANLREHGCRHALVSHAFVTHLGGGSQTLSACPAGERDRLMGAQRALYHEKWFCPPRKP